MRITTLILSLCLALSLTAPSSLAAGPDARVSGPQKSAPKQPAPLHESLADLRRAVGSPWDVKSPPPFAVGALKASYDAHKLIVVIAKGTSATVYALEKTGDTWTPRYQGWGFVGKNGVHPATREGAKKTPAGVYELGKVFGNGDNPGSLKPYTKLTPNDFWVDDPDSRYYNMWVSGNAPDRDWKSAENLSTIAAYKYAVVIEYNTRPIVKGAGSAFFLHCATDKPTLGCVSVPEGMMEVLLRFIDDKTKIVIAASLEDLLQY